MLNYFNTKVNKIDTEIWPNNFDNRSEISKEEKECARYFKRKNLGGVFVLGVNPTGSGKLKRVSYTFSKCNGVKIYFILDVSKEKALQYIDNYIEQFEELNTEIIHRLLDSLLLINRINGKKSLNFPVEQYILFQSINYSILTKKEIEKFKGIKDKILFKNFTNIKGKNIYDLSRYNVQLTDNQIKAIIERLSPEYAIVVPEKETISEINKNDHLVKLNDIELEITGKELENKIFALDNEQINLVNEIRYGHRLILANPGAGKSVILLAKAFRISKIYDNDKVLVSCYNNNLAEAYNFRKYCSGIKNDENLYILTFHKLVLKILKEKLGISIGIKDFDYGLDILEKALDENNLNLRFKAIFIDEVQVFEPRWLDICYKLLKKDDENIFLIAGDLNQNVKNMSSKGQAVWQQMQCIPSDFKGRVKYIRKNYRNNAVICNYVNNQLKYMVDKMNELDMNITSDFDFTTHGTSCKLGGMVELDLEIKRLNLKSKIKAKIKEINERDGIDYSDIAIIIPFMKYSPLKYYPISWIIQALEEESVNYRTICNNDSHRTKYGEGEGVIISTIDSALGLDFKAVVLTALYPLAYVYDEKMTMINSWEDLNNKDFNIKELYFKNLRKIYTASSRARENLYILSDLPKNSPINELLNVRR